MKNLYFAGKIIKVLFFIGVALYLSSCLLESSEKVLDALDGTLFGSCENELAQSPGIYKVFELDNGNWKRRDLFDFLISPIFLANCYNISFRKVQSSHADYVGARVTVGAKEFVQGRYLIQLTLEETRTTFLSRKPPAFRYFYFFGIKLDENTILVLIPDIGRETVKTLKSEGFAFVYQDDYRLDENFFLVQHEMAERYKKLMVQEDLKSEKPFERVIIEEGKAKVRGFLNKLFEVTINKNKIKGVYLIREANIGELPEWVKNLRALALKAGLPSFPGVK